MNLTNNVEFTVKIKVQYIPLQIYTQLFVTLGDFWPLRALVLKLEKGEFLCDCLSGVMMGGEQNKKPLSWLPAGAKACDRKDGVEEEGVGGGGG